MPQWDNVFRSLARQWPAYFFQPLLQHESAWVQQMSAALLQPFHHPQPERLCTFRRQLNHDPRTVLIDGITRPLRPIIRHSTMPLRRANLLARMVQQMANPTCLELGTSAGFTTATLAAASGNGRVITVDSQGAMQALARTMSNALGLTNIDYREGLFTDVLPNLLPVIAPIHFALVDGDHQEEPTLQYLEMLRPHLQPQAVVALDDIHHSDAMRRCWRRVQQLPWISATIEFNKLGFCIMDAAYANTATSHVRMPKYMVAIL